MAENDRQGNICLVTGANTGIGKYTVLAGSGKTRGAPGNDLP